jgi:hypothetical protein
LKARENVVYSLALHRKSHHHLSAMKNKYKNKPSSESKGHTPLTGRDSWTKLEIFLGVPMATTVQQEHQLPPETMEYSIYGHKFHFYFYSVFEEVLCL